MTAKTGAQRVKAANERKEAQGLKQVRSLWAHPEDIPTIREFADKLARKRAKKEPK